MLIFVVPQHADREGCSDAQTDQHLLFVQYNVFVVCSVGMYVCICFVYDIMIYRVVGGLVVFYIIFIGSLVPLDILVIYMLAVVLVYVVVSFCFYCLFAERGKGGHIYRIHTASTTYHHSSI